MERKNLPPGCEPRCRGCAHRQLSAADSEGRKVDWLNDRLSPWADRIMPIQAPGGQARWGYRDRACLRTEWTGQDWRIGMPLADRSVLDLRACPVHSPSVNRLLNTLRSHLPAGDGFPLAYVVKNAAQVALVVKTARLPASGWLNDACRDALRQAGIEGFWLHLHPAVGRKIFNKPGWHLLFGEPWSRDHDGLWYGVRAFRQLIPALAQRALERAADFLALTPGDLVIDLYSGNGRSLNRWQRDGALTLGVELDGDACFCAARNAPHSTTLRGTCSQRLPQLDAFIRKQDGMPRRCLYANPPRTGLEPAVLDWIGAGYRPSRIAYLSCSAGTLRRDLDHLSNQGYRVEELLPLDFFPHTYHVETLALLELNAD